MSLRKHIVLMIVLAAALSGVAMWGRSDLARYFLRTMVKSPSQFPLLIMSIDGGDLYEDKRDEVTQLKGPENAEELLAYAAEHPEYPWLLWRWFGAGPDRWYGEYKLSGRVLSQETEELRNKAEKFKKRSLLLRDRDSENGLPLAFLAYLEVYEGVALTRGQSTGEPKGVVMHPERAANAAKLLHEAAGKKKVTMYGPELVREAIRTMGAPENYDEYLSNVLVSASTPIMPLLILRVLTEGMCIEAGRLLKESSDPASAYAILHDLQTLGAKIIRDNATFIDCAVGRVLIMEATEKGVGMLEESGHLNEANQLFKRGAALVRPKVLAILMRTPEERSGFWGRDPELVAEAVALADRAIPPGFYDLSVGYHFMLIMPSTFYSLPNDGSLPSMDEMQTTANFEYWGWERAFINLLAVGAWLLFLVMIVLKAAGARLAGKTREVPWPSARQMLTASLFFGLLAALPGMLAALVGHGLHGDTQSQLLWLLFWNIWGFAAAVVALRLWARSQGAPDANAPLPIRPRGILEWGTVIILAVMIPLACLGMLHAPFWLALACILLLGLVVMLAVIALAGCTTRFQGTALASPLARRIVLVGWAGGLLLWFAAYFVAEVQERAWGRRDTLLLAKQTDTGFSFSPVEARMVSAAQQPIINVLTKENEQ